MRNKLDTMVAFIDKTVEQRGTDSICEPHERYGSLETVNIVYNEGE